MNGEAFVIAGGVYCLAFAVFHLMFWRLFRWRADLRSLTAINRAVMQILNLCLTFVFVLFGALSLLYPADLAGTPLGRTLLLLISVFWLLRAIEQIVFFGLRNRVSAAFFLIFLLGAGLYAAPMCTG